jgi:hypothetical protein
MFCFLGIGIIVLREKKCRMQCVRHFKSGAPTNHRVGHNVARSVVQPSDITFYATKSLLLQFSAFCWCLAFASSSYICDYFSRELISHTHWQTHSHVAPPTSVRTEGRCVNIACRCGQCLAEICLHTSAAEVDSTLLCASDCLASAYRRPTLPIAAFDLRILIVEKGELVQIPGMPRKKTNCTVSQ